MYRGIIQIILLNGPPPPPPPPRINELNKYYGAVLKSLFKKRFAFSILFFEIDLPGVLAADSSLKTWNEKKNDDH